MGVFFGVKFMSGQRRVSIENQPGRLGGGSHPSGGTLKASRGASERLYFLSKLNLSDPRSPDGRRASFFRQCALACFQKYRPVFRFCQRRLIIEIRATRTWTSPLRKLPSASWRRAWERFPRGDAERQPAFESFSPRLLARCFVRVKTRTDPTDVLPSSFTSMAIFRCGTTGKRAWRTVFAGAAVPIRTVAFSEIDIMFRL